MVASFDLIVIVLLGIVLFSVPFIGSVAVFALGALLFLLVTLGLGVLIRPSRRTRVRQSSSPS